MEDGSIVYDLLVPEEQSQLALKLLLQSREGKGAWWFKTREEAKEYFLLARLFREAYDEGLGYLKAKDPENATACFSVALRIDPDSQEALLKRAEIREQQGLVSSAITDLEHAMKLSAPNGSRWLREKIESLKLK